LSSSEENPYVFAIRPCPSTGAIRFNAKIGLKYAEYHTFQKNVDKCIVKKKTGGAKISLRCKHTNRIKCKAKMQLDIQITDPSHPDFWNIENFKISGVKGIV